MAIKDLVNEDMKTAMREKKQDALAAIRMAKSAIKNAEIDAKHDFDDAEVIKIVMKEVKTLKESFEEFAKAGREEAAAKTKAQMDALAKYLPTQLSEEEIRNTVAELIGGLAEELRADKGQIMKVVMPALSGKADGKLINKAVSEYLQK